MGTNPLHSFMKLDAQNSGQSKDTARSFHKRCCEELNEFSFRSTAVEVGAETAERRGFLKFSLNN